MINSKNNGNNRNDHLYWVNVFDVKKDIPDVRITNNKSKILKITKNQILNFKSKIEKNENLKNNLNEIIFDFNSINFGLWDFGFCKLFFKNQNDFFEIIKTKENSEFLKISKNLLIKNIDIFLKRLDQEIDNIEVLKIQN